MYNCLYLNEKRWFIVMLHFSFNFSILTLSVQFSHFACSKFSQFYLFSIQGLLLSQKFIYKYVLSVRLHVLPVCVFLTDTDSILKSFFKIWNNFFHFLYLFTIKWIRKIIIQLWHIHNLQCYYITLFIMTVILNFKYCVCYYITFSIQNILNCRIVPVILWSNILFISYVNKNCQIKVQMI